MENSSLTLDSDVRLGMGNCAVVATSIFCDKPYTEVEAAYREIVKTGMHRRDKGRSWGNPKKPNSFGLYRDEQKAALRKFNRRRSAGFKHKGTLLSFVRNAARPGVRYYVVTKGHAQVVQDGVVIDQGGPVSVENHWGKRKQVEFCIARK